MVIRPIGRHDLQPGLSDYLSRTPAAAPPWWEKARMLSVKRALLMSTGERYVMLVTNFATAAAVSRILSPEEIGVSVIGMAILAITISFREFSGSSYLIQPGELRREDIRGAFTA